MKILVYFFICSFLLFVLLSLVYFLSLSVEEGEDSKGGPFECGFQPFSGSSFSFSMPFFVVSLMFLLFDVEILLVCFYPLYFSYYYLISLLSVVILFLVLFSTLYEWSKGILSWV